MPAAAPIIGAIAAAGAGIANNVAQNKARGQARYAFAEQMRQAEIDRQNRTREFEAGLQEQDRIHRDNMANARNTLALNREAMNAQIAASQAGLAQQQQAMAQQQANAERNFAMQQAQTQRAINMQTGEGVANFKRGDNGVAGTILSGPSGVEKKKMKLGASNLLGG